MQLLLLHALGLVVLAAPPPLVRDKTKALLGARPTPPTWVQSWAVANSTVIYACNYSGFYDPDFIAQFALVQLDWSTGKDLWANMHPMDAEQLMVEQVDRIQRGRPGTITMVYRNTVKALSWFGSVRAKLSDAAYAGWFLPYKSSNPVSPACDVAHSPPLCTTLYHDQMQTPQYHVRDDGQNGTCESPCDSGGVPTGEYLWDLRNESARAFILADMLGSTAVGHPHVTGLYLDDYWTNSQEPIYPSGNQPPWGYCTYWKTGGPSEIQLNCIEDMGLTQADVHDLYSGWRTLYGDIMAGMDKAGAIAFQSFHSAGTPDRASIQASLRALCAQGSSSSVYTAAYYQTLTTPPACCPANRDTTLLQFDMDLAYFMLVRGPWAWLGYSYTFCAAKYTMPPALFLDYGDPLSTCAESAPGIFTRRFAHAVATVDTNAYTGRVALDGAADVASQYV